MVVIHIHLCRYEKETLHLTITLLNIQHKVVFFFIYYKAVYVFCNCSRVIIDGIITVIVVPDLVTFKSLN